jgi:hypothetical protein
MNQPDPDKITSALYTQAPRIHALSGHWKTAVTVYTETRETYIVTGYDRTNPRLSACSQCVPVSIGSIYEIFDREHPAMQMLGIKNEPILYYS